MPSGKTHDRITLWMLPFLVGCCYFITRDGELTLLCSGGFYFSGLMFGPDLDIYSVQFKRWGVLKDLWLPYQKIMRHRSFFSHGFIIGTVIRIIYLMCYLFFYGMIIFGLFSLFIKLELDGIALISERYDLIVTEYKEEVISLFIGLEIGAMSHSISDWVSSAYKKRTKQTKQKSQPRRAKTRKSKPKS